MSSKVLDILNFITVSLQGAATLLQTPNINTCALFSRETPSWGDDFKIYLNATDVGTDFGTSSNAYKIAVSFFAQQPNSTSTGGYLVIIPRASAGTELVQTAIARTKDLVFYYGILVDEEYHSTPSTLTDLAAYVQGIDKMLFYAASNAADYASGGLLDLIRQASDTHTRILYYNNGTAIDTQKFAAAYAAHLLSVDFTGSLTMATLHGKALSGLVGDTSVDQTALVAIGAAGADFYGNFPAGACIFTSGENAFSDYVYGSAALKYAIQTAGFNYLKNVTTKIPQTESGMEGLKGAYRDVMTQFVKNGFLAPGSWTASNFFGNQAALIRNVSEVGYYIYSSPVALQLQSDREDRKAPLIQIAAKTANAIHSSSVVVNVNI